jgi:flagellar biosynthetic protein FliO
VGSKQSAIGSKQWAVKVNGMTELNLVSTGLKTAATLFLVLGLLILVLYIMKRFVFLKRGIKGDLLIKVISSLHLSPKARIEVIEISGERIVLGITPGNIRFLTKLNDLNVENEAISQDRKDHGIKE